MSFKDLDFLGITRPAANLLVLADGDSLRIPDGKLELGPSGEATIYYDGNNLIINPRSAGVGDAILSTSNLLFRSDVFGSLFGNGDDASVFYNGTNFVINAQRVGSGHIVLNSPKTTTGDPPGVEGLLYWNTVDNVIKLYADGGWRTLVAW